MKFSIFFVTVEISFYLSQEPASGFYSELGKRITHTNALYLKSVLLRSKLPKWSVAFRRSC
jgi:hypothetical protein